MRKTTVSTVEKPAKPRPDFPLFAHASGKWAKTIRNHTYYFGTWSDPAGAESDYLAVADDLHAGRTPSEKPKTGGASLSFIVNKFLAAKEQAMKDGELSPRTFIDYKTTCEFLVNTLGSSRLVSDLKPDDFARLKAAMIGKKGQPLGASTRRGMIVEIKGVFKYANENILIDHLPKYGSEFKGADAKSLRKAKGKAKREKGSRAFEAAQIRALLGIATVQLKAMILLGINCGFGNTDCALLPLSALDLKKGWVDFPRPKTGAERRIPLWKETVEALKAVIANRRQAVKPADAELVFLTRLGLRWVRYDIEETTEYAKSVFTAKQVDSVTTGMDKLLRELKLKRPGLSFYSLRHTFETVAGGSKDQVAVDAIMGHIDNSMAGNYRHGIDDSRLKAVVDHVHNWLFSTK